MEHLDFPSLGEPAPIELANTWYEGSDETHDFLAPSGALAAWFVQVLPVPHYRPAVVDDAHLAEFLRFRDAVRALVVARVDSTPPPMWALDLVNRAASSSPPIVQLEWCDDGPVAVVSAASNETNAAMGHLASGTINLLAAVERAALARCAAEDCSMLFVRTHGRRRFCNDDCSHRERQARYDRRRRAEP